MPGLYRHRGANLMTVVGSRDPQVQRTTRWIKCGRLQQAGFRYASCISICESRLAFADCIGYPKALAVFLGQGFA